MSNKIQQCGDLNAEIRFGWHLTNWCNYKCSYCMVYGDITNDFTKDAHTKDYKLTISKLKLIDRPWNICLTGGETTLHPQIFEIVSELVKIPTLTNVWLFTNLSRSVKFYEQLKSINSDKIVLYASYHPEYHTDNFLEKCIEISKDMRFSVHVSLSDKHETWSTTESVITELRNNKIDCRLNLLSPTQYWTPNYTEEFYKIFYPYLESEPTEVNEIPCVFDDGTKKIMRDYDISLQGLNNFHGYKCVSGTFQIGIDGKITNTCTDRVMPILLKTENLLKEEPCPKTTCDKMLLSYFRKKE